MQENKKNKKNLLILIVIILIILVCFIVVKLRRGIRISGVWELEKTISNGKTQYGITTTTQGIEKTIYTFNKDGNCNETIIKEGIEIVESYNYVLKENKIRKEPFSSTDSNKCTYKINSSGSEIKLFWEEMYDSDLKEYYDCNWNSTCPDKPTKEDYIDKMSIKIYDNYIFIDGEKYLMQ